MTPEPVRILESRDTLGVPAGGRCGLPITPTERTEPEQEHSEPE